MKIIQSYWSAPVRSLGYSGGENRRSGGWPDIKLYYMSWALSCLSIKALYPRVELITDSFGKRILMDKIGLPYDACSTELDSLNGVNSDLWARAKFKSYLLQNEPFIHIDNDIFIWRQLQGIESHNLVVQNHEIGIDFYKEIWRLIQEHCPFIPDYIISDFKSRPSIHSCNAGVFGGKDLSFIKEFANEAQTFLSMNDVALKRIKQGGWSVLIYEQYLFSCLARSKNKEVHPLFEFTDNKYTQTASFEGVPYEKYYVHAAASTKHNPLTGRDLAFRLRIEYPDYFYRIEKMAKDHCLD